VNERRAMTSPIRNLAAGSGVAVLLAIVLAAPTIAGIASWKIFLAGLGLILFMLSSRRGAETK
jgi:hypothetical protein